LKKTTKHPFDAAYDINKQIVDALKVPMKEPLKYIGRFKHKGTLTHTHRRGLLQFESYWEANHFVTQAAKGPCSFFIKGYVWPWHSKRNYVGILFPTSAAPKKEEKI
jgi:hypothetical protein